MTMAMTTAEGDASSPTWTLSHPSTLNPPPKKEISLSLLEIFYTYINIYINPQEKASGVCGSTVRKSTGLITE